MSRRSSRRAPIKKALSLPAGVTKGLASLVEGNESIIASMLSVDVMGDNSKKKKCWEKEEHNHLLRSSLTDCMAVNDLSAEALLARFFDVSVLRTYCEHRLGVSGKGNEATLAARIARAWSKPNFDPLPSKKMEEDKEKGVGDACNKDMKKCSSSKSKATHNDKSNMNNGKESPKQKKKKRSIEATENVEAKKRKKQPFSVTAPPGPIGLTIKQYCEDFIVTEVSPTCAIPQAKGTNPKIRPGIRLTYINGLKIKSVDDDILTDKTSDKPRVISVAGWLVTNNAADKTKGELLYLKETNNPLFRVMEFSTVAKKYGQDFLEELDPPQSRNIAHFLASRSKLPV